MNIITSKLLSPFEKVHLGIRAKELATVQFLYRPEDVSVDIQEEMFHSAFYHFAQRVGLVLPLLIDIGKHWRFLTQAGLNFFTL